MTKAKKTTSHPWVSIAAVCEKLLEEKDNVMTLVRMVDTFIIPKPEGWDQKTPIGIPMFVVIGFKSGNVRGKRTVKILGTSPKGKSKKISAIPVDFQGG